ncbi:uncharacterized protein METZ01_LOCUS331713, partial [marine metagenome]
RTQLASFDMGRTYEGLTVTDSITIFNAGGSDLVITDISSDNNAFTLSASSATINSDGNLSIFVTFAPTAAENYTGHIVLTSNSASSPDTVTVVGVGGHSLLLSSTNLNLNTYPGLTVTNSFTISNAGGADLVITDISSDNNAFILSGSNATVISSGNYINVSVSLSPTAGESYTGNIVITSSSGSSPDIVNLNGGSYSTWGGPDETGYLWVNSFDDGGPSFSWIDTVGATATGVTGDDILAEVVLPFSVEYYGVEYDTIAVVTNGWIGMGPDFENEYSTTSPSNYSIPDANEPNKIIAPLWNDWMVMDDIFVKTVGSAPNRQFVVIFHELLHYGVES